MAIVFPASPSTNDTFTAGSITYKWDGDKWIGLGVTPADRIVEGSNSLEITAGNDLVWTGDNIGIGISNPSVPLHISGTNGILIDDSTNQKRAELRSKNDIVELNAYDPANTNAPVPIVFKQYTSERLRISGDGQVLIGTDIQNSFNGVGQAHNLIVAGSTSDTDITDNSKAAITISNKDGTANNTAGLHFAREDTDGNPHYSGASIVAQFTETQVTGQYPKADLAFLTSTAANNAPSQKMRLTAGGTLIIGTSGLTNNTVYHYQSIGNGLIKKYYITDNLAAGQLTRFTFSGTNRTCCMITINAVGSWTASNTGNNHPAAQFVSRVMTNSSGDSTDSSTVTTPFAYVYSTGSYAFNNAGSFGYSIDITNPTGDSGVSFSYEVIIQSAVVGSQHVLVSSTTA